MGTFQYTATDLWGQVVTGRIEARTEEDARLLLLERQLTPEAMAQPWWGRSLGSKRVKKEEVATFTGMFSALLRSNLKPREALEELREEMPSRAMRDVLSDVAVKVGRGRPLAEAFGEHPDAFSPVYVAAVAAGEASSSLKRVTEKLSRDLQRIVRTRRKVIGALTYPAVVLTIVTIVGIGLLYFIVPQIAQVLIDAGGELPLLTRILLGASRVTQVAGPFALAALVLGAFGVRLVLRKSPELRERVDAALLRVPVAGKVVLASGCASFAHLFSTLMAGRASVTESTRLAAQTVPNLHLRRLLTEVGDRHLEGRPLWEEMRSTGVLPSTLVVMTKTGERSANLAEQMESAGCYFDEQVDFQVERMLALLGPLAIVLAFIPVIMLVMGIYIPMIQAVRSLG